ncbi:hypothetical protein FB566_4938 [Stackebrandtia endophytica]|uniref:Glyoxalase-like domain-containing protein n=1 Tax=Stackebrandtia endophytica TaxID=1496996 RepID=A0A543B3C2_9ACTN|nr:VOC family protein [Stackebrandtia endophytica]TQL79337.1 hypothetical protein FB566_4938 [Stackebrandtia endophytica]
MAELRDLVIDAEHAATLARFWSEALDGYRIAPYDDAELARLKAEGIDSPEGDPTVLLEPLDGAGPRIFVQTVPELKSVKNRLHLDLWAADHERERDRLIGLGAEIAAEHPEWTTLTDPQGNEFCLMR